MKRPLRLGEGMQTEQGWHATDCQPIVSRRSIRVRQIHKRAENVKNFGRGDWIRTSDPLRPRQVRYQAALRPDSTHYPTRRRKIPAEIRVTTRPTGKGSVNVSAMFMSGLSYISLKPAASRRAALDALGGGAGGPDPFDHVRRVLVAEIGHHLEVNNLPGDHVAGARDEPDQEADSEGAAETAGSGRRCRGTTARQRRSPAPRAPARCGR